MSKSMEIKYHYAHIATQGKKFSMVDLIDQEKGLVKINDSIIGGGAILARLSSEAIKLIFEKGRHQLDVDLYSGIVRISLGYHYNGKDSYWANFSGVVGYQSSEEFGYVIESPPRLAILFIKKLASVESFQLGKVKIHVSSLDINGYIDFLFGEGLLTLARIVEPSPLPPFEEMVIKEVREQKDENTLPAVEVSRVQEVTATLLEGEVDSALNVLPQGITLTGETDVVLHA